MKSFLSFLFFTICLIKGHMGDDDAVTGGSMIINCIYITQNENTRESAKSFCKVSGSECTTMTEEKNDLWIAEERFSMIDDKSLSMMNVLIRNLTVTDSGTYRCQAGSQTIQTVNFNVKHESCCGRSEEQTAYLGGTGVIHCKYPRQYKVHGKQLFKVQNGSLESIIAAYGSSYTDGRFSLNVNEQEHVFTVTFTGVRRRDAGVYFCGIYTNHIYTPLFTEIQLHVSDQTFASVQTGSFVIIITAETLVLLLIAVPLIIVAVRMKNKNKGLLSSTAVVFNPVIYEQIRDTGRHCNPDGSFLAAFTH